MKVKIFIAAVLISIPTLAWVGDIMNDRAHKIIIKDTVSIYKTPEEASYNGIPFETVEKNEKVNVKRITYGKDFMTIKIEKQNGSVGWVISNNNIKVVKP